MNKDDGFTLVEVVVAIAVVAIVSTSIFQMFVTSSHVNRTAKVMDIANIVAVRIAEEFKADLEVYGGNRVKYNHEFSYYDAWYQSESTYYDGWEENDKMPKHHYGHEFSYYGEKGEFLASSESGVTPAGAVIQVESRLPEPITTGGNNTSYYPDFTDTGTLNLSEDTDYDVEITTTCQIKVKAHGTTGPVTILANPDISHIKNNILPIRVNFPSGGTYPRTIYLANDSDFEAELYVFNAKVSDSKIMPEQIVILNATQGSSSITYVPVTSSSDTEYDLTLIVSGLNKNGSEELFRYLTKSYLHN